MSAVDAPHAALVDRALELHPRVALRPEPFGALAYHYDTRRLVFLKHPDIVHLVESLSAHPTLADALDGGDGVEEQLEPRVGCCGGCISSAAPRARACATHPRAAGSR